MRARPCTWRVFGASMDDHQAREDAIVARARGVGGTKDGDGAGRGERKRGNIRVRMMVMVGGRL